MSITNHDILRLTDAAIKRWTELTREELGKDIEAFPSKDVYDQWVLRAYWDRLSKALFGLSEVISKPATVEDERRLIERMFGHVLNLPAHRLVEDVNSRLESIKKRTAREFEREFRDSVNLHQIESPIEQIFLMEWKFLKLEDQLKVKLTPQKPIQTDGGRYFLDFEIIFVEGNRQGFRIGIEIDGHEFHERTREQVARDKRRERALVRAGVTILRFSGSEVFRNARSCVMEVAEYIRRNGASSETTDA